MTWSRYYVERNKLRADGDVDHESKECYTEASARSTFADYESKAYVDTTYPFISLMLCDCHMIPMKHLEIQTSYVVPETEAETTEA